jgi:T5SS/PEP-CTERM-associated repeat protein
VTVTSARGKIGNNPNSAGRATVSGVESKWISSGSFSVGYQGAGELNIENGGQVISGFADIGRYSGSRGTATVTGAGSKWVNSDDLGLQRGELRVENGGLVASEFVQVYSGGILRGSGGTVQGDVYNAGTVAPGGSAGTLTIDGNYEQDYGGKLIFELGGAVTPSAYDHLIITGEATLGGTLQVLLIDGFTASAGQSFDLLDWSSVNSTFDSLQLPTLPSGLSWNISRLYTTGVLSVAIPGDFDSDGDLDGADFVAWQTNFPRGSGATLSQGDSDGDGDVDGADFVAWQTHFPFAPASGVATVPEPTAAMLLFSAAVRLAIVAFRRSMKSAPQLIG